VGFDIGKPECFTPGGFKLGDGRVAGPADQFENGLFLGLAVLGPPDCFVMGRGDGFWPAVNGQCFERRLGGKLDESCGRTGVQE